VQGIKPKSPWYDGLSSLGFDFSVCPCLPSDVYIDENGITIVAKRVDELTRLRRQQARFAGNTGDYARQQLAYYRVKAWCDGTIAAAGAGSFVTAFGVKRRIAVVAEVGLAFTLTNIGIAFISCGAIGEPLELESNVVIN
jgi:hypothetical protein